MQIFLLTFVKIDIQFDKKIWFSAQVIICECDIAYLKILDTF